MFFFFSFAIFVKKKIFTFTVFVGFVNVATGNVIGWEIDFNFLYYLCLGLVAKIEKNLTDHTEFLNYKHEMDKWLEVANDTLENCAGIENEEETRQKLITITVSTIKNEQFSFVFLLTLLIFHAELIEPFARRKTTIEHSSRCIYKSN